MVSHIGMPASAPLECLQYVARMEAAAPLVLARAAARTAFPPACTHAQAQQNMPRAPVVEALRTATDAPVGLRHTGVRRVWQLAPGPPAGGPLARHPPRAVPLLPGHRARGAAGADRRGALAAAALHAGHCAQGTGEDMLITLPAMPFLWSGPGLAHACTVQGLLLPCAGSTVDACMPRAVRHDNASFLHGSPQIAAARSCDSEGPRLCAAAHVCGACLRARPSC